MILEFIGNKADYAVLILETEEDQTDSFIKKLRPLVKTVEFSKQAKLNVFDLTRVISEHRSAEALKILAQLQSQGDHPLQIMGGLVWFWGKSRGKLSVSRFENGLKALQEADLNIKRSRLEPDHALEVAVIKLCSLVAG